MVMDYAGSIDGEPFAGGEGRDQMVELGSGRLVPGFEEQLERRRGRRRAHGQVTFPDDYGAEELAGQEADFAVTVKEVKAKDLPALDDDLAAEAGLRHARRAARGHPRARWRRPTSSAIEAEFREAALDAAVANATVEVPDALVEARSRELWDQMLHSLSHQGISKEMYLRISGREEDEIVEEGKDDAEQALRREAVLAGDHGGRAVSSPPRRSSSRRVEQSRARGAHEPEEAARAHASAGRLDTLKAELAQRKALDLRDGVREARRGRARTCSKLDDLPVLAASDRC